VSQLLLKMAKFNRVKLDKSELDTSLNQILNTNDTTLESSKDDATSFKTTIFQTKTNKFKSLFVPCKAFMQTMSFVYIWFTASLIYYGVSLG
jgi:hypothetical protein